MSRKQKNGGIKEVKVKSNEMAMSPAPTSQVLTIVIFNLWVKGSCAMMVAELDFHMDPECTANVTFRIKSGGYYG